MVCPSVTILRMNLRLSYPVSSRLFELATEMCTEVLLSMVWVFLNSLPVAVWTLARRCRQPVQMT